MIKKNLKAQIWFTDFAIALVVFSFVLISYYTYTKNISKQDFAVMEDLISDAKSISSSLTSSGYPDNWNSNNVARIGFTDNYNRMDNLRFVEFTKIDYNKTKRLLGTPYEYILFFVNGSNDVQNIEGFCGTGNKEVNITYEISAAYYYEGPGEEDFLKNFMEDTFQAEVYYDKTNGATIGVNDQSALRNNINRYDFVVLEHPYWSNADFNDFVSVAEPWVQNGGILFLGGEMGSSQQSDGFGVIFKKISGTSESDRLATIVNEDPFVAFAERDNVIFRQAFYLQENGAGIINISKFNGTYVEFDDIKKYGQPALARWNVGEGKILFFSDFDADYLAGNFQDILEGSAKRWANAMCLPINISSIERENLVKVDRLAIHNSDQVKMVLYLWQ